MKKKKIQRRLSSIVSYLVIASVLVYIIIHRQNITLANDSLAPLEEKITLLNGNVVPLSSYSSRPMVINFWASWCPPCLTELPDLERAYLKYKNKVSFVGAAIESETLRILELKEQFSLTYPLAHTPKETQTRFRASVLPTTYVIGRDSKIVWSITGPLTFETLDRVLRKLLSNEPT